MKLRKQTDPATCCAQRCKRDPQHLHTQPDGSQLWWCPKHSAEVVDGARACGVFLDVGPYQTTSETPPPAAVTTLVRSGHMLDLTVASLDQPEVILSAAQLEELALARSTAEQDLIELREIQISAPDDARFGESERAAARAAAKHWDDLRAAAKAYWLAGGRRVDETLQPAIKALKAVDQAWSRALNAYRASVAAEQQRLLQEAELAAQAAAEAPAPEQPAAQAAVRETLVLAAETEPGTQDTYIDNWKFRIEDAAKVPREYLCPDLKRIGQVVEALKDACVIPGVVVYNEPYARTRR